MPQIANETALCGICNQTINIGDEIRWNRRGKPGRFHATCKDETNPAPASDSAAALLAAMVEPYLTIQREQITSALEEYVSERIQDAMASLPKEPKTVYIQSGKTIGTVDGHKHEHFDLLVDLVSTRQDVYLWGEAGSGKTSAAKQMAAMLGLPFYYLALNAQTTELRLMGYCDATRQYFATDFYRAYSQGGVFLLDELELGQGNLLGALNGALANGIAAFPCGMVERHPNFICIATGNTPAMGASILYSDRRALDGSIRDRFLFIQWDTDETLERQLAAQQFDRSESWVSWVRNVRELCKTAHPKVVCTQRASIKGAGLLARGIPVSRVADMLVFRGIDTSSARSILAAYPLPIF